jgi:hypothetical protein
LLIKICPTISKAHPNSSYLTWIWCNIIFSERIIQYSRTFTPQVQTSWNQANAPLLVKSFPKIPWTQYQAPRFGGSHSYKTKQIVRDSPLSFVRKEVPCHNHGGWFTFSLVLEIILNHHHSHLFVEPPPLERQSTGSSTQKCNPLKHLRWDLPNQ